MAVVTYAGELRKYIIKINVDRRDFAVCQILRYCNDWRSRKSKYVSVDITVGSKNERRNVEKKLLLARRRRRCR